MSRGRPKSEDRLTRHTLHLNRAQTHWVKMQPFGLASVRDLIDAAMLAESLDQHVARYKVGTWLVHLTNQRYYWVRAHGQDDKGPYYLLANRDGHPLYGRHTAADLDGVYDIVRPPKGATMPRGV